MCFYIPSPIVGHTEDPPGSRLPKRGSCPHWIAPWAINNLTKGLKSPRIWLSKHMIICQACARAAEKLGLGHQVRCFLFT